MHRQPPSPSASGAIELDGAMGEGGGQILRSALSLSLLTGRSVALERIRANRARPGLGFQHLMAVQAAARIARAQVTGDRRGSQSLHFVPGAVEPGAYRFDIGTAGATALVLQTVLLPLACAPSPSHVTVTGGTHVPWSPCFHYLDWHWRAVLARLGVPFGLTMTRAGFYPQGGGEVHVELPGGAHPTGIDLADRGRLLRVRGLSGVANLPAEIAARQRSRTLTRLHSLACAIDIAVEAFAAHSRGTVLVLLAEFEHSQACFFALGARGKRAEEVADEAVDDLLAFLSTDGAVDRWLADQLLVPLVWAGQAARLRTSEVTAHLLTNAEVIRRFLPVDIAIDGEPGQAADIRIGAWRR